MAAGVEPDESLVYLGETDATFTLNFSTGASMVLATASSDERLEKLKPLGLTHGINYLRDDVISEVARLTDKHMADVIVDAADGDGALEAVIDVLFEKILQRLAIAGGKGGDDPFDLQPVVHAQWNDLDS